MLPSLHTSPTAPHYITSDAQITKESNRPSTQSLIQQIRNLAKKSIVAAPKGQNDFIEKPQQHSPKNRITSICSGIKEFSASIKNNTIQFIKRSLIALANTIKLPVQGTLFLLIMLACKIAIDILCTFVFPWIKSPTTEKYISMTNGISDSDRSKKFDIFYGSVIGGISDWDNQNPYFCQIIKATNDISKWGLKVCKDITISNFSTQFSFFGYTIVDLSDAPSVKNGLGQNK